MTVINNKLSIIIPVYNEEENVERLYEKLVKDLEPLQREYEILFVDDGSVDSTYLKLKKIATLQLL